MSIEKRKRRQNKKKNKRKTNNPALNANGSDQRVTKRKINQ